MNLKEFLSNSDDEDLKLLLKIINENKVYQYETEIKKDLIFSFAEELWDSEITKDEKFNMIFELYEIYPSYSVMARINFEEAYKL